MNEFSNCKELVIPLVNIIIFSKKFFKTYYKKHKLIEIRNQLENIKSFFRPKKVYKIKIFFVNFIL